MFNYEKVERLESRIKDRDDEIKNLHERIQKSDEITGRRIDSIKHENALQVAKMHSEYFIKLTEQELRMNKSYHEQMIELMKARVKAEADSQAKELVIKAKDETMKQLQEQLKFVFTKIPSFDLNKLNFSVHTEQTNK